MALETAALGRNLSRVELAVSIVLIAVLFLLFMQRMGGVEAAAEKSILRTRYQDMQTRLMLRKANLVLQDRVGERVTLSELVRYIGRGEAAFVADASTVDWDDYLPGAWVYDESARILMYRVISEDHFDVRFTTPKRVGFQLIPSYVDTDGNGRYDPAGDRLTGARIRLLDERSLVID